MLMSVRTDDFFACVYKSTPLKLVSSLTPFLIYVVYLFTVQRRKTFPKHVTVKKLC